MQALGAESLWFYEIFWGVFWGYDAAQRLSGSEITRSHWASEHIFSSEAHGMGSSFAQRLSFPTRLKILKARGSESAQSPWHMEFYFIYCHINRHIEDQSIQSECGFLSIDQRIQRKNNCPFQVKCGQIQQFFNTDSLVSWYKAQWVFLWSSCQYFAVACVPPLCCNLYMEGFDDPFYAWEARICRFVMSPALVNEESSCLCEALTTLWAEKCVHLSFNICYQLMKGIMKINSSQNSYFQYELTFAQWLLF